MKRHDPDVIAARAHAVLDAAARAHGDWPAQGRPVLNQGFLALHVALEEYDAAADGYGAQDAAETAALAMTLLLIPVSAFLGKAVAEQMMRDAAEVTR
jgi:hypothetical protein